VYAPTGVCDVWPLEKEFDRDSYIGVPMFDSAARSSDISHAWTAKRCDRICLTSPLFKIFSVRAAAELERMLLGRSLKRRNQPSTSKFNQT
jgi:hypothetical protein